MFFFKDIFCRLKRFFLDNHLFLINHCILEHYHETLSEALQGTELEFSGLEIQFKESLPKTEYCKINLDNAKDFKSFIYSVKNHYWYQMYLGKNI